MAGQNKKISELSAWAANPEKMRRFEQVVLLTQRTAFVKILLDLSDNDDLIRSQIQVICKKNSIPCRMPRGTGFDAVYLKALGPDIRYAASLLLSTLLACGAGALVNADEALAHDNLVDRMIYAFRRYLHIFLLPVHESPVSFEMFYHLYKLYESSDIEMVMCQNCDSNFVNLKVSQSVKCPLCQTHMHAEMKSSKSFYTTHARESKIAPFNYGS